MIPAARRRRIQAIALAGLLVVLAFSTCYFRIASPTLPRPASWAERVPSKVLKNWYKLDEDVYRSNQPNRAGFEEIRNHGIKTILNLRHNHSDDSIVEGLGFNLVRVPMTAAGFTEPDVVAALKVLKDCPKPVLIHCQRGADRSGVISAMYRVVFQGWSKEDAIAELRGGGFNFHTRYKNIPRFIRGADIDKIRKELGIAPPQPSAR
jgi:tyrosine-protein phosphatase SIW14